MSTSQHLALARKWRPQAFHEVVGQQHTLKALENALNNNQLHHAYLFTGTRGISPINHRSWCHRGKLEYSEKQFSLW